MNKRIQELADKAGIKLPDSSEYNGHIYRNSIERFAELIVQDCVAVCDAYGMPDGTSATAALLSAAIKRKFDIEDVDESLRRRGTYFGNNP